MGERVLLAARKNQTTARWWDSATHAAESAPPVIRALLDEAEQVEASRQEADEAFLWAIRLPGWTYPQPVYVAGSKD
jgi:hypothetical protein